MVPGGDVPESAQWAPRGNRLAYTSSDASLTLYQPDNGSLTRREVVPAGSGVGRHVAWTSDGDTGAYERHQMVGQGLSSESLWTQAITGRSAQPVYSTAGNYSLTLCCWTGSAQYLLFWQGPLSASLAADGFPLYVVRATSSQPVQISAAMLPYSDWVAAVASTDVLAFIAGTGREMTAGKSLVLAAASPASTGEVAVRSITMESDPNLAPASPAWRPRTSTLAYSVGPSLVTAGGDLAATLAGRHIWLVQADSSDKHALLSEATVPNGVSDERPLWSTDGKVLIFARRLQPAAAARAGSTPTPGALELWISSPTGTDARRVVGGLADPGLGSFGHVDWSAVYSYLPD